MKPTGLPPDDTAQSRLRLCLFGAAGDTANLGVSALEKSTVRAILARRPETRLTVFDNGWGHRSEVVNLGEREIEVDLCGARLSRRVHRPESWINIRASARLGGLMNPAARAILSADAVLDISGGDSFSDIYGQKRLRMVCAPKRLSLDLGIPLILLPQTYGPFEDETVRHDAVALLRAATAAWARDPDSYAALRELLGGYFDPARHHEGVDVAFLLPQARPDVNDPLIDNLETRGSTDMVGLNVSGLIYNSPELVSRLGIRADYRELHNRFVTRVLEEEATRVLFVVHVGADANKPESDLRAALAVRASLDPDLAVRTSIAPVVNDPCEAKWIIGRTDWFCGTRMHSTIAGLSSGVPTAGIAYSDKMRGVFASCGQQANVVDARSTSTDDAVDMLLRSWRSRAECKRSIQQPVRAVQDAAQRQIEQVLETCEGAARRHPPKRS